MATDPRAKRHRRNGDFYCQPEMQRDTVFHRMQSFANGRESFCTIGKA